VAPTQRHLAGGARFSDIVDHGQRFRGAAAGREEKSGKQPLGDGPGRCDIVRIGQHSVSGHGVGGQRYRIGSRHQHLGLFHVNGRGVLSHGGADEQGRVFAHDPGQAFLQQITGQLAHRQRQPETHDLHGLREGPHYEVRAAVGARLPGIVAHEHGDGPGPDPGLHVEGVIADHQQAPGVHPHPAGHEPDGIGERLRIQRRVAGHDRDEIRLVYVRQLREGHVHGGATVPGDDGSRDLVLS